MPTAAVIFWPAKKKWIRWKILEVDVQYFRHEIPAIQLPRKVVDILYMGTNKKKPSMTL